MALTSLNDFHSIELIAIFTLIFGLLCIYFAHKLFKRSTKKPEVKFLTKQELLETRLRYYKSTSTTNFGSNDGIPVSNPEETDQNKEKIHEEYQNKETLSSKSVLIKKISLEDESEKERKNSGATSTKKFSNEGNVQVPAVPKKEIFLSSVDQLGRNENLDIEVKPLKTLEELMNWTEGFDEFNIARIKILERVSTNNAKTMICHDMKGGYIEDRFPQGFQSSKCYRLSCWNQIDSFCYFSHNFISIPPPCWTNVAHTHGVKSFGTLITEWNEGAELCQIMLIDEEQVARVVKKIVDLTLYYNFDGWLINIENNVMPSQVDNLVLFLQLLTLQLHDAIPGSEVIWYDSVLTNGQLKWQNKLCSDNRRFFDACDGIFLNYNWSLHDLHHSLYMSGEERRHDIYVGVDVFGRGCFGGGGWNTYKALQAIREKNMSAAIFAPGWVMENCGEEKFTDNNKRFWDLLMPYLHSHKISLLPITTSFCQGYGNEVYLDGQCVRDKPWTNLSSQNLQPTFDSNYYQLGSKDNLKITKAGHTIKTAFNGGECYEIIGEVRPMTNESRAVFRLFQTGVSLISSDTYDVEYTYKTTNNSIDVALLLLFEDTPKYHVFTRAQADDISEPQKFALSKNELFNYVYSTPTSCHVTAQGWTCRRYKLCVDKERTLQEIRFVCCSRIEESETDQSKDNELFELHIGSLRIEESNSESKLPEISGFRCRNYGRRVVDGKEVASFILLWDGNRSIKCYDIFVKRNVPFQVISSNNENKPNLQPDGNFAGRSYADSFCFSDFDVSDVTSLYVKVVSISENDVRQSFNDAPIVKIFW